MKEEIHLGDIAKNIKDDYARLDPKFLRKLLENIAQGENLRTSEIFAKKLECSFNKKHKTNSIMSGWLRTGTIKIAKLIKIMSLSEYSWRNVEKNLIFLKAGRNKGEVKIEFPLKIDKKLGSIIGHILGDGSIDKGLHSTFFSNSDITLLEEFRYNMKDIFKIEPRIWIKKGSKNFEEKSKWIKRIKSFDEVPERYNVGLFYPKICSDIFYALFGKFAEGKEKRITREIKGTQLEFKKGLIRAFFDDDGSIIVSSYSVRFSQDDKKLLEDIRSLMGDFDIKTNEVRFSIRGGKRRHEFCITGFREYYMFYNKIGCSSPHKKERFELLINKVGKGKFFRNRYKEYKKSICFEGHQF